MLNEYVNLKEDKHVHIEECCWLKKNFNYVLT